MDRIRNPYSPGAGRKPTALVGRDRPRTDWEVAVARVEAGRSNQPFVLYGLRGVGKTVLLSDFRKQAAKRGWLVAQVEAAAGNSLREAIGEALHAPLVDLVRPSVGTRLARALKTALSFKASYDSAGTWNFGLDLDGVSGGGANTGVLETDLRKLVSDLADAAEEEGVGLAILIDEAQDLSRDELIAICAIAHSAAQDDWRVLFALAGLPSLPRVLAEAKSYAERFNYEKIEALGSEAAAEALTRPAGDEGVRWESAAIDLIVQESAGYPYFLQQFGQESWIEATGEVITRDDARVGAANGHAALDSGFFRARWDRGTRGEQAYMRAMADDGDSGSASGDIAARLGRSPASVGPARASLIAKGLVYAPEHGVVAFTVPGMSAFVLRQPLPGAESA